MRGENEAGTLPVTAARAEIEAALAATGCLVLSAPPGTGKSTQVPRFVSEHSGQVWVLQPRRIAARTLAARVAEELGEALGRTAGYQVRFENASGPDTRILFQTYGTFRQRLLRDPELAGVHTVVIDEFHERAWEADLALLWCRELRRGARPDLRLLVMSATLEVGDLRAYLPDARILTLPGRVFPVAIRHQPPRLREYLPLQIARALKSLAAEGWSGSALVFLPGAGEIRQAAEAVDAFARGAGFVVRELHGSMPLDAQRRALAAPLQGPTILLTTNVAETSLTVPGITAVIDAGLQRVAAYDPERDLNTLYVQPIAAANAVQRAGRAGRTAPGLCIRLWDAERDARLAPALLPEVRRVELSEAALAVHALIDDPGRAQAAGLWPTPPDTGLWERAVEKLRRIAALVQGRLTPLGRAFLSWPAPPELACVLHAAAAFPEPDLHRHIAAMAAVLSAAKPAGGREESGDLFARAETLAGAPGSAGNRDATEAFQQFLRRLSAAASRAAPRPAESLRSRAGKLFLPVYLHRLAARDGSGGQSFVLSDGRRGLAPGCPAEVKLILALEIHESGGKDRVRQTSFPLFLPLESAGVEAEFPDECRWESAEEFDAKQGKVVREDRLVFRNLVLDRRAASRPRHREAGELLAEQLRRGEIELPLDDEARQWIFRIRLAQRVCPEQGLPALDEEDWDLLYHEICAGKKSAQEVRDVSVSAVLREYLGPALTAFLEREAPVSVKLPAGRRPGKITYFENTPPELSARLGDLLGMQGAFKILRGRVEVSFDILAPNFRTVQKTANLTSFWQNTYPEIKKELKRRYPRHPWP